MLCQQASSQTSTWLLALESAEGRLALPRTMYNPEDERNQAMLGSRGVVLTADAVLFEQLAS